jgi:hypothetical protein
MNTIRSAIALTAFALLLGFHVQVAFGQSDSKMNFPDRKPYVVNNSPFLQLSNFRFSNQFRDHRYVLITDLTWKNVGTVPITAFEIVLAYYDPFNRSIRTGGRWLVPGTNSANYSPLAPGASSSDGTIGIRTEDAYTGFAFVRAVRLQNGTVWMFDEKAVEAEIKKRLPQIKDFRNINPELSKKD